MNVTPHFSIQEFASHDGEAYPSEWISERLSSLCNVLEVVRTACGNAPITVISGYRSPAHNLSIGGARMSQHMQGRAADVSVKGYTPQQVYDLVLRLFVDGKIEIGGLGVYRKWVHIDIRPRPPNGHVALWSGSGHGAEVA